MLAFSLGFSQFHMTSNCLDEFLEKQDLTLDEILNEENIVNEIKSNQQKFGKILLKYPYFPKQLLDYIITEPSPDQKNSEILYKFPFISSEIFTSENKILIDSFFMEIKYEEDYKKVNSEKNDLEENDILDPLLINDDDPLRSKDVIVNENNSKQEDFESENNEGDKKEKKIKKTNINLENIFVKDNNDTSGNDESAELNSSETPKFEKKNQIFTLLDYLFTLLDSDSCINPTAAGYFQKILNCILNKRGMDLIAFIFDTKKIIPNIMNHISNTSISNFLLRVINLDFPNLQDKKINYLEERKEIIKIIFFKLLENIKIEEEENLTSILNDIIVKHSNIDSGQDLVQEIAKNEYLTILSSRMKFETIESNSFPISIFSNLINYYLSKEQFETPKNNEEVVSPIQTIKINEEFTKLCDFLKIILSDLIPKLKENSQEEIPTTFGIKIKPFGSAKLKILDLIYLSLKIPSIYEDLLSLYEWNSFVHMNVEKIIFTALDLDDLLLNENLFEESKLLNIIIELMSKKEFELSINRNIKRGNIAFLIRISNYIIKLSDTNDYIKEQILKCEKWNYFKENILKVINKNEAQDLGGQNPKKIYENEVKTDGIQPQGKTNLQKIYEKFSSFFIQKKLGQSNEGKSKINSDLNLGENKQGYLKGVFKEFEDNEGQKLESNGKSLVNEFNDVNHDRTHLNKINERANLILASQKINQEEEIDEIYYSQNFWKPPLLYNVDDILIEMIPTTKERTLSH